MNDPVCSYIRPVPRDLAVRLNIHAIIPLDCRAFLLQRVLIHILFL